jgi:hypothetical protein
MKIEIDLKEILEDEFGDLESLGQSIERQVVESLTESISKGILKKVDESLSVLIDKKIEEFANDQLPNLFENVIDSEYTIVDRWGDTKETTTMRKKLISVLTDQMVYKSARYESDKNYFTKNVDEIMKEKMQEFKALFDKEVNSVFKKEAFEYALIKMRQTFKMAD